MHFNLPNILTFSRIAAIPVLVALFMIPGDNGRWLACAVFTIAAITDYFDGYIARTWGQLSELGRCLDPIADKLLVAAVLLLLAFFNSPGLLFLLPAMVILCREMLVSGLREYLAQAKVRLPVSRLAKWKTAIQMVSLGFLIVSDSGPFWLPATEIGLTGIWIAAMLTLVTGYDYLATSLRHMENPEVKAARPPAAAKTATPVG
jgi:cardiolipin synthase (CMP-forming)